MCVQFNANWRTLKFIWVETFISLFFLLLSVFAHIYLYTHTCLCNLGYMSYIIMQGESTYLYIYHDGHPLAVCVTFNHDNA